MSEGVNERYLGRVGEDAGWMQRMVVQGLGRRLLPGRPPRRRLPQVLLEVLQLRRDRFKFLQDSLALHDRAMEEEHARRIPLLAKGSQEDHPRQQAAKLRGY